jgi:hypothetical protein
MIGHRRTKTLTRRAVRIAALAEREAGGMDLATALVEARLARPKFRSHCTGAPRPCPFVTCRHHLAVEVTRGGGLKVNHPDVEIEDLAESCALDVADRGGITLEEVGTLLNVTRERIRQEETSALAKYRDAMRRGEE